MSSDSLMLVSSLFAWLLHLSAFNLATEIQIQETRHTAPVSQPMSIAACQKVNNDESPPATTPRDAATATRTPARGLRERSDMNIFGLMDEA